MTLVPPLLSPLPPPFPFAHRCVGQFAAGSLDRHNNIKTMVDGGSKGSFINIAQMIGNPFLLTPLSASSYC